MAKRNRIVRHSMKEEEYLKAKVMVHYGPDKQPVNVVMKWDDFKLWLDQLTGQESPPKEQMDSIEDMFREVK